MAKNVDMSAKNYSRLRATEEGEEVNWASVYVEGLRKRAAALVEKGGTTVVHAHLRALAMAAATDPEAKKASQITKERLRTTEKRGDNVSMGKAKEVPLIFKGTDIQEGKDIFDNVSSISSWKRKMAGTTVKDGGQQHNKNNSNNKRTKRYERKRQRKKEERK